EDGIRDFHVTGVQTLLFRSISRLFQVDLADGGPSGAVLGGEVLKEIQRGIALLARLAIPRQEEPIERFRQRFLQRYEEREVPLRSEERRVGKECTLRR